MKTLRVLLTTLAALAFLSPGLSAHPQRPHPNPVPDGLAKSDWASIREAWEAGRHAVMPAADGHQARNPGQQWLTTFDSRGFTVQPDAVAWQWGLELRSYGFDGNERAISGPPAVQTTGTRLTYVWDSSVEEWFVNDRRGLEHGFTLKERPMAGAKDGEVSFSLKVRGTLLPAISANAVLFQDESGATVLTYAGLKVWDADGKNLRAHFAAAGDGLQIMVDERGARYPITVDPIAQQAYLKASNTDNGDGFGTSVAVSGDTVVVGAWAEDGSGTGVNPASNELASQSGAVYVFVRSGATWSQQALLKASNTGAGDYFGSSVAVDGDTIVVGAYRESSSSTGVNPVSDELAFEAGAAYVFVRTGATWSQQAWLKASNTGAGDVFGWDVAVFGDTVVVAAPHEDGSGTGVNPASNELATDAGAVYVFGRSGVTWSQQAMLKASNTQADDGFGWSVGMSLNRVVVGASGEDSSGGGVGSSRVDLQACKLEYSIVSPK